MTGPIRVIAIQGVNSQEPEQSGGGWRDDLMFTLNTRDQHMIACIPMESSVSSAAEQLSMFSWEAPPANPSALRDSEKAWMIRVVRSCLPILRLLADIGPDGWFGRTCPASCHRTKDGILAPSSGGWLSSGMGSPTGFLTLNTSAWPSAGAACSLSAILETGDVPQRFYLSAKACRGILRRASKRDKQLPAHLEQALNAVAAVSDDERPQPII